MNPTNNLEEYFHIISKKTVHPNRTASQHIYIITTITTKLLQFYAYKLTVVRKLYNTDHKARLKFV
jgi:hypothetical protein